MGGPLIINSIYTLFIYPYIVTIVGIYWVYPRLLGIFPLNPWWSFSSRKCQQKTPALLSFLELFPQSENFNFVRHVQFEQITWTIVTISESAHAVSFFEFPGTQKQRFGTHAFSGSAGILVEENLPSCLYAKHLDPGVPRPNEKPPMRLLNDNVSLVRTRGRGNVPVDVTCDLQNYVFLMILIK